MIYMFNTAYCIMKEELPYTLYTTMLKLQVKNGSDLGRISILCFSRNSEHSPQSEDYMYMYLTIYLKCIYYNTVVVM
jgi:hypothetical protein